MTTTRNPYTNTLRQDAVEAIYHVLQGKKPIDELGLRRVAAGAVAINRQFLLQSKDMRALAEDDQKAYNDAVEMISDARDFVLDEVDSIVATELYHHLRARVLTPHTIAEAGVDLTTADLIEAMTTATTDTYANILRQDALEAVDYVIRRGWLSRTRGDGPDGGYIDQYELCDVAREAIGISRGFLRASEEMCELADTAEADGASYEAVRAYDDAEQALSDARDLVLDEVDSIVADAIRAEDDRMTRELLADEAS